jgi:hypothetical protein
MIPSTSKMAHSRKYNVLNSGLDLMICSRKIKDDILYRVGPLHLWRCAPIGYGVGIAMVILCVIVTIYYNVIMAYSVMYLGASFVGTYEELPWTYCGILNTQKSSL